MKIKTVQALSDEEIRIKVAEFDKWKSIEPYRPKGCQLFNLFGLRSGRFGQLPNYPQDLNAMHEAEEAGLTTAELEWAYADQLNMLASQAWFATARQRAEAFILTMDKS